MKMGPCKTCQKRYRACWDTCPAYAEWKAELEAVKVEQRKVADERRMRRDHMEQVAKRMRWGR